MISVITPVRNTNPYLDTYIRAMLDQTDRDFELVLVDDGSTDGVDRVLEERLKSVPRLQVIRQAPSGILTATMNGIHHCSGEYVAFVDSDDIVSEDFIASLNRIVRADKPDVLLFKNCSYRDYPVHTNDSGTVSDFSDRKSEVLRAFFLTSAYRTLSEKCIRKALLEDPSLSLPYSIKHAPDVALSIRPLILAERIFFFDQTLYFAPVKNVSTNKSYVDRRFGDYERVYRYAARVLDETAASAELTNYARTMFVDFTLFSLSSMFYGSFDESAVREEFLLIAANDAFQSALGRNSLRYLPFYKSILAHLIARKSWPLYRLLVGRFIAPMQMKALGIRSASK